MLFFQVGSRVLDNGYEVVCDDCNIYLYFHSILAGSQKGKNFEMLFKPSEEQFDLPLCL